MMKNKLLIFMCMIFIAMPIAFADETISLSSQTYYSNPHGEIVCDGDGKCNPIEIPALEVIQSDIDDQKFSYSGENLIVNFLDGYDDNGTWISVYTYVDRIDTSKELSLQKKAIYELKQKNDDLQGQIDYLQEQIDGLNKQMTELCDIKIFSWCVKI